MLGLNPATCGEWVDTGEAARLWNKGLREIQAAGLRFPKKPPVLRASWRLGGFTYNSTSDFQNSVFALWQERWRAKICPMCESYFVADEKATKFCSAFCAREGKNERNRRWWRDNGPEWKQKFLQAKNRARKARRRKGK